MKCGRSTCVLGLALAMGIAAGETRGATRYVWTNSPSPSSPYNAWSSAAHEIQTAVDVSSDGDTVLVTNGTYQGVGAIVADDWPRVVSITNGVIVRSVNGPALTIVDGQYSNQCFGLDHANAVADGFTMTRGTQGAWCGTNGGTVMNSIVCKNINPNAWMGGNGAGVGCTQRGLIYKCVISGNVSHGGAGVYLVDGGTVSQCVINCNTGVHSAGMFIRTEAPVADCASLVTDCIITENSATGLWNGAGVTIMDGVVQNCVISSNAGGGVWFADGGTGVVRNCVISRNQSPNSGAGVSCNGGGLIWNSTICNNASSNDGGGIFFNQGGAAWNCIIYSNTGGAQPNVANYQTSNNCFYSCYSPSSTNQGNITNAPDFVSLALNDYHLKAASPCIDNGSNSPAVTETVDLDGQPRVFNSRVDIGADEASIVGRGITCTNGAAIVWDTIVGAVLQLRFSTNLPSTNWISLGAVTTSAVPQITLTDTNSGERCRFYRLGWFKP